MRESAVIGIAQWLAVAGEPERNLETALGLVRDAAERGCDLVVLPELWPCGYDRRSLADDVRRSAEPLTGDRIGALSAAAREHGLWVATGSVPEASGASTFNTSLLLDREGRCRAVHRKTHLFPGEERIFAAGRDVTTCETDEFGVVGLAICFDGDFPEVARALAGRGARVVVHVSAYGVGYRRWWEVLYPANALLNGQWWFMANQRGRTSTAVLLGESQVVSPTGEVVYRASGPEEPEPALPELAVVEVALLEELRRAERTNRPLWAGSRTDAGDAIAMRS